MTMFESICEMNDDIQHDCNDSFATMFIEESACALWNNQQRKGVAKRTVVDNRQLRRGVLWISDNSPTTQPRRVVDNRQLTDNSAEACRG